MFNSLNSSVNAFKESPIQFAYATFVAILMNFIVLFALAGIYLIFFFVMSILNLTSVIEAFAVLGGVLAIVYLYFFSAFKGALLNAYSTASKKSRVSVTEFYNYALSNGFRFFSLKILQILLLLLLIGPLVAFYFLYLKANPIKYADYALLVLGIAELFFVELFFYPAYVSATVFSSGVFKSLKFAFTFFRKKHLYAFLLFVLYCFVWLFNFIPVIQLVTLFVVQPIIVTAMILFVQNTITKQK
ncbi:hypothetical protein HZC08_01855 [Candidatus Micrarchaeota archaeon]|nr:hypothetical protein [Candidatus Micrarchaeota archaeon]